MFFAAATCEVVECAGANPDERIQAEDAFIDKRRQTSIMLAEELRPRFIQPNQRFDLHLLAAAAPQMHRFGVRREVDFPARRLKPIAPIDFFRVHEERLVHQADFLDDIRPRQHKRPHNHIHRARIAIIPIGHHVFAEQLALGEHFIQPQRDKRLGHQRGEGRARRL